MIRKKSYSVGSRIMLGLGAIILLQAIIVLTAFVSLNQTLESQRTMLKNNLNNLHDLPTLRSNINAQRLAVATLLELPRGEWGSWIDDIRLRRAAGDTLINNLILRFRENREESNLLGAFIEARERYQVTQDSEMNVILADGSSEKARKLFIGIQMENHERMRSILARLEQTELAEARSMVASMELLSSSRMREFLLLGLAGLAIVAVLAAYIRRTISKYIRDASEAEEKAARANRALKMLNACNGIVIRASDEMRLLEDICREIVEVGGYKMAWVGYADDDKSKSVRPMAFAGDDGDYIEHANISWGDNERGRGPTGTCIRTGEPVVARDTSTQPGYEPWRYRARLKGYRSSATLPLKSSDRVYGAVMVYSASLNAFDQEETGLLGELADDLAYAVSALRDQAGRAQAEKRVRESAAYARSLLDASMDPLLAVSLQGRITDVNPATEQLTGKSRSELVGQEFAGLFVDHDYASGMIGQVVSNGFVRNITTAVTLPRGKSAKVICDATVYRGDNGEVQGMFVVARAVMHD